MRHVVEQDAGMFARVLRAHVDAAAAGRAHRADVHLEAVCLDRVGAVVVDRHRQEVVLQVRPVELGVAADEAAGLELVAGADAGAQEQPLGADRRLVVQLQCRRQRHRLLALVLQVHLKVVLQVGADARQVVHQVDVEAAQQVGRADARTLQDLRRGDGAAAQQHAGHRQLLCVVLHSPSMSRYARIVTPTPQTGWRRYIARCPDKPITAFSDQTS
ncbi:hypothetical protein G6F35_016215 [Rhizopus arrhizus]|nr:hypothetical protein G6F35_016215 [Rhizopus arrhizus]